jgi:hypothetical protein
MQAADIRLILGTGDADRGSGPRNKKERGKLPAPITRGLLRLALALAAGPVIWGELVEPAS